MILVILSATLVSSLWFSTMTLIILQVMHSSLYTSVDDKLHGLRKILKQLFSLLNRATEEIKDLENALQILVRLR